jgi:hypothetical protein
MIIKNFHYFIVYTINQISVTSRATAFTRRHRADVLPAGSLKPWLVSSPAIKYFR